MAEHNLIGKKGEEKAIKYLQANGYKIRHCNWRHKKNEIDIICEKNNQLIVVEVKTRTSEYFENPKEAVTKRNKNQLLKPLKLISSSSTYNSKPVLILFRLPLSEIKSILNTLKMHINLVY